MLCCVHGAIPHWNTLRASTKQVFILGQSQKKQAREQRLASVTESQVEEIWPHKLNVKKAPKLKNTSTFLRNNEAVKVFVHQIDPRCCEHNMQNEQLMKSA